jgi:Tol biopolymer transport system component/DNA-binding winged helix-turn-helix (wHTH) protein
VRFGPYELDLRSGELKKSNRKLNLPDQSFRILCALIEQPGEVVLRDEIRKRLWPDEVVVEFDHSINTAVKRLRDTLCDSVEKPRYIETLARKGYRFIGKVETEPSEPMELLGRQFEAIDPAKPVVSELVAQVQPLDEFQLAAENPSVPRPPVQATHKNWRMLATGLTLVAIAAGIAVTFRMHSSVKLTSEMTRLTFDSGLTTDPAISPDGKLLAYATDRNGSGALHIWVQQFMPDGQAVQLTRGDTDDHQPAFSPDGSKIVFRSERDGGGIYVIPAIGGESTLIARGGRDPRLSPDGRWIAYWQASMMVAPFVASAGTVYVVASAGGPPQPLRSDLTVAGVPEWSDDNKRLIVFGRKDDLPPPVAGWNWWVIAVDGGPAISTNAFALLREKGFNLSGSDAPRVARWHANELLFVARRGDTTNVWNVEIDRSTSRVSGDPHQLTAGTGLDAYPSVSADGHLLFAILTNSKDVWILPANTNAATVAGPLRRITETAGSHLFVSLSADGNLLAYSAERYGRLHAWIKNLKSNAETPVATGMTNAMARLSSDGSLLAYTTGTNPDGPGFIVPVRGGAPDQVCTKCQSIYDISPDNHVVLYRRGNAIRAFDLISRRDSLFMQSAKYHVYQDKFSPDGRWVTFEAIHDNRSRVYVTKLLSGAEAAPETEWIPVTADEGWADKPRWSPDGNLIYFVSNRDGFFCLWAQRVSADSKQPIGPLLPIAHFHGSRLSMANIGAGSPMDISVARDKIALNLGELTGNIWTSELSR